MMSVIHILLLCELFVFVYTAKWYDCHRSGGFNCLHGGQCHYYGFCICPKSFQGVDCGLKISSITPKAKCTVKCQNGGTCYNKNRCYCPYNYVGDTCELPRTYAKCGINKVTIEAYRPLGYIGETYLIKNRKICKLLEVPSDIEGFKKYSRPIKYTDKECSVNRLLDTPKAGQITFKTTLVSTYNYNQFGPRDFVFDVSCIQPTVFIGSVKETTESSFPFRMVALDMNGEPVQALAANESIILQFEPLNVGGVKGVMLDYLEVYSISTNTNEVVSKAIVVDGCVLKNAEKHLEVPIKSYTEFDKERKIFVARVSMKAFILLKGEPLLFKSVLRFCPEKCHTPSCYA